jgi:hypothetical protein
MILDNLEESIIITNHKKIDFVNDNFLNNFEDAIKNYCVNKPVQSEAAVLP